MITLNQFVDQKGSSPIQEHYDDGTVELRTTFDVATNYLVAQTRGEWRRPNAAKLMLGKGFRDYFEIRFMSGKLQQRPIGYFHPDDKTFVLLLWATEKGGSLDPAKWKAIADKRRGLIESGTVCPKIFRREYDQDENA